MESIHPQSSLDKLSSEQSEQTQTKQTVECKACLSLGKATLVAGFGQGPMEAYTAVADNTPEFDGG